MTIQLQSIGRVNASLAQDITPGTVLMWNFGETSTILEIVKQTAKTITVKERSDRSGNIYERRFNKTRKLAIVK